MPLVLGGDHSIALGTVGGMAAARGVGAAIWLDAHGDLNTPETTPSGNVHGMPLAAALGAAEDGFGSEAWPLPALDPARTSLVGVRQIARREAHDFAVDDYATFAADLLALSKAL